MNEGLRNNEWRISPHAIKLTCNKTNMPRMLHQEQYDWL